MIRFAFTPLDRSPLLNGGSAVLLAGSALDVAVIVSPMPLIHTAYHLIVTHCFVNNKKINLFIKIVRMNVS